MRLSPSHDAAGCVGPFFAVGEGRTLHILVYAIPLCHADTYGEMLTVERGHAEIWDAMRALGIRGMVEHRLPRVLLTTEYDEFPRGRVVHDPRTGNYTIWADPKLHWPETVEVLRGGFSLDGLPCRVARDPHYRTWKPMRTYFGITVHQIAPLLRDAGQRANDG